MATAPAIRQYSNRRTRKSVQNDEEARMSPEKEKRKSPLRKIVTTVHLKDSHPTASSDSKKKVLSASKPQIIVRKFDLPVTQVMSTQSVPLRDFTQDFQKPKQRWKQLCNLNQEMSTTLPVAKMKIVNPSTPVTRELRPGTLQSNASKVDIAASKVDIATLKMLLNGSKLSTENAATGDKSSILYTAKPVKNVHHTTKEIEKTGAASSSPSKILKSSPISTTEPLLKAVSPIKESSSPGTISTSDTNNESTFQTDVSSSANKIIAPSINQSLPSTFKTISSINTSSSVIFTSPKSNIVHSSTVQTIVSGSPTIIVSSDNQLQSYKTLALSSSLTSSGTNIVLPPSIMQTSVPSSLSSNIITSDSSHSVNNKEKNLPSGEYNIATSVSDDDKSTKMDDDSDNPLSLQENFETIKDIPEAAIAKDLSTDGCGLKIEPKHNNIGVVGGKFVILQQLAKNKFAIKDMDQNQASKLNTIILQNANLENKTMLKENSTKDPSFSLLKATLLRADSAKEKNEVVVNPKTLEANNLKSVQSLSSDVLTKPVKNIVAVSPEEQNKQVDSSEKSADVNGDPKKTLNLKQLQHEIALMKARQNIALQVEREVLRAKDVKIVREVHVPARTILVTDTSCQTNLFSLVEPGRMVEMLINPNKTVETAGMVNCKGKLGSGETGSGDGRNSPLEEPDKKRPRLDQSCASGVSAGIRTAVSDISVSSSESQNSVLAKNINVTLVQKSNTQLKGPLGYQQTHKITKQRMEDNTQKSVFDIIVQHNIANQAKVPPIIGGPMVYIPESNSVNSSKNNNSNALKNVNNGNPMLPLPQNLNSQETAARISELKRQAFEDWSRCLTPDANGNIPLHKAVIFENLTLVKRQCVVLCARKASLDVYNNEKMTPLHLAVDYGNADIVRMLLSFGAQANVKDYDGNTALHLAVMDGNHECVEAILNCSQSSSLPLDDFNDEGYAPMHLCALRGKVEETRLLISRGADVNLKDARSGRTPLFHAVEANCGNLVQLLLTADANTNEPNFAGHTPLTAASEISFTTKPTTITDEMNFNSKLVSLRSGEDIGHILEDGSNILIRGDIVEDINMDEDIEIAPKCCKNTSNNVWMPDI